MVYAADSKSAEGNLIRVRVPSPASCINQVSRDLGDWECSFQAGRRVSGVRKTFIGAYSRGGPLWGSSPPFSPFSPPIHPNFTPAIFDLADFLTESPCRVHRRGPMRSTERRASPRRKRDTRLFYYFRSSSQGATNFQGQKRGGGGEVLERWGDRKRSRGRGHALFSKPLPLSNISPSLLRLCFFPLGFRATPALYLHPPNPAVPAACSRGATGFCVRDGAYIA